MLLPPIEITRYTDARNVTRQLTVDQVRIRARLFAIDRVFSIAEIIRAAFFAI